MSSFLKQLIIQTAIAHSSCFLPNIITGSPGGLTTAPTGDPTAAPTHSPTGAPTGFGELEEWDLSVESHLAGIYSGDTDLAEWAECFSDSIIFDLADGAGSALNHEEYVVVFNTFGALISSTDMSIQHGSAEYVDERTVEINYVETMKVRVELLGGVGGAVEYWLNAMGFETNSDGEIEWDTPRRTRFHFDDKGAIDKITAVSPVWRRQLIGMLLSVDATAGPLDGGVDATGSLSLFGYNAIWVLLVSLIATTTVLIAVFVWFCLRICARREYVPVVYSKVDIVTDSDVGGQEYER